LGLGAQPNASQRRAAPSTLTRTARPRRPPTSDPEATSAHRASASLHDVPRRLARPPHVILATTPNTKRQARAAFVQVWPSSAVARSVGRSAVRCGKLRNFLAIKKFPAMGLAAFAGQTEERRQLPHVSHWYNTITKAAPHGSLAFAAW